VFYWPSLHLLAWFAARFVDNYCVPGVVGDGVEEICRRLGVGPSRLTRFVNTVDIDRHVVLDASSKAEMREKNGIPADAIVITTICRLVPEKGVDIALEGVSYALSQLSPELRARVCFIIAGDGVLRKQIEEDIYSRDLSQTCLLWGEATQADVLLLHSISDIYLYTGTRGGGYSLVMLEAMASGCAVIASAEPLANVRMLAEGRGITVPVGDAKQTGIALVQLVSDSKLLCQMGHLARDYVAVHNTAAIFRRVWMRTTYWSALDNFLKIEESKS
jgi:glycosyltransferase involved in cell wall biosynthesis